MPPRKKPKNLKPRLKRTKDLKSADEFDPPRTYIVSGKWPHGQLAPDAPPEARLLQGIARDFDEYRNRDDYHNAVYVIAHELKLSHATVYNILRGTTWPNLITIARLEILYKRRLWGNEHLDKKQRS